MFLYTIIPPEFIFEEDDSGESSNKSKEPVEIEIHKDGISLMVSPMSGGQAKINRIISTDPNAYLNPDWQPGSIMSIY